MAVPGEHAISVAQQLNVSQALALSKSLRPATLKLFKTPGPILFTTFVSTLPIYIHNTASLPTSLFTAITVVLKLSIDNDRTLVY